MLSATLTRVWFLNSMKKSERLEFVIETLEYPEVEIIFYTMQFQNEQGVSFDDYWNNLVKQPPHYCLVNTWEYPGRDKQKFGRTARHLRRLPKRNLWNHVNNLVTWDILKKREIEVKVMKKGVVSYEDVPLRPFKYFISQDVIKKIMEIMKNCSRFSLPL